MQVWAAWYSEYAIKYIYWNVEQCNSITKSVSCINQMRTVTKLRNEGESYHRFPYGQHAATLWNLSQSFVLKFHIWVNGFSLSSEGSCAKSQYGWNGQLAPLAHFSVNALGFMATYKCVPRKKRSVLHFSSSEMKSSSKAASETCGPWRESWAWRVFLVNSEASCDETRFWTSAFGIAVSRVDRGTNTTESTNFEHFGSSERGSTETRPLPLLDWTIWATPWSQLSEFVFLILFPSICKKKNQRKWAKQSMFKFILRCISNADTLSNRNAENE